jgi:hypothetical protein
VSTKFLILLSVLVVLFAGCAGGSRSVKGTWEMIYPEEEGGNAAARNIKIVSDTHFAFGSGGRGGGVFAGGGTYSLGDSTYTEFIRYHTLQFLVGSSMEFKCILEGDRWYHSGSFDIGGRKFTVSEIWRRIDD